jgi:hypothetical protein
MREDKGISDEQYDSSDNKLFEFKSRIKVLLKIKRKCKKSLFMTSSSKFMPCILCESECEFKISK